MTSARRFRGWILAVITAATLVLTACAPDAVPAGSGSTPAVTSISSETTRPTPVSTPLTASPTPSATQARSSSATVTATGSPAAKPTAKVTPKPSPTASPTPTASVAPTAKPGPALMQRGSTGDGVRDLQARLKQIGWFSGPVTGYYGEVTTEGVRGFQAKRGLPVTGAVDRTTLDRLQAMTRKPTAAELTDAGSIPTPKLDPRCLTGRAMCISKTSRKLVWVIDGEPQMTFDVRFGSELTPTREGQFRVEWKSRDHVSTLYGSAMPYSMFFSGGQAVHYSADFARNGYNGSSHGCVNVRDYNGIAALYGQALVGDKVIVYQ